MSQGIDCNTKLSLEQYKELKNKGVTFVGRYISTDTMKSIDKAEVLAAKEADMYLVLILENSPLSVDYFTEEQANSDLLLTEKYITECGIPNSTTTYYTIDYDCQHSDFEAIGVYAKRMQEGLKSLKLEEGAYGNGTVLQYLQGVGFLGKGWLSQSKGFSGYNSYYASKKWSIAQNPDMSIIGIDADGDSSNNAAGGFLTNFKVTV